MILSTNFLKDYLDIDFDTDEKLHELAENMTKVGNEYDSEGKFIPATNLVIGEVKECTMHFLVQNFLEASLLAIA